MSSIWYLQEVNLHKLFCPHKYKAFGQGHSFKLFNKNDYIYFEDDPAIKIYLIENGKVKIGCHREDGRELVKCILGKGEIFGETAILGEEKRNEFALCVSAEASICPVSVEQMRSLMRKNQKFSLKIYKFLGLRFKRLERQLEVLLFKDVKTRVREFLSDLSEQYGYCCPNTGETVVKHHYTQKDMATLLGTSRSTLNITLNEFKTAGMLDFSRSEFRLKSGSAV